MDGSDKKVPHEAAEELFASDSDSICSGNADIGGEGRGVESGEDEDRPGQGSEEETF
jgi:hypothetical protein